MNSMSCCWAPRSNAPSWRGGRTALRQRSSRPEPADFVRNSGRLSQRLVIGHGALTRDEGGDARQRHLLRKNCVDGATNAQRILAWASDEIDLHGVPGADGLVVAGRDDQAGLQLAPARRRE